ncbi:MAG: beta-ketoacyl synthase N-terminal-like domain-containing protein, partial [Chloroflexales bacterium]
MEHDPAAGAPSPIKRALLAIETLQAQIARATDARHEPIAVIGMACRFPGAAHPDAFWELLQGGRDQVRDVPPTRWDVHAYYDPEPGTPGKLYQRTAALLEQVDQFDPAFFGISPRETVLLDPQQRLLLEVSWEALERAALVPQTLRNSKTGVFLGVGANSYRDLMGELTRTDSYASLGNSPIFAAGRLSYHLGAQGPSLVVDTACSASLISVHLACESLRNRTSDLALAGGVHLLLTAQEQIALSQLQALAPDGRCKTFDVQANGFGCGEGCGIIVLKRLSDAQADGDPILALIRGSATNHDGPSSGLTVPSAVAQTALIRAALADGRVAAQDVSYVEAHGTGTVIGDPIEVRALDMAFGERTRPLWVGSVKTNIGHLQEAAGIAGLMKVIVALQHGEIPASLHVQQLNPHIDWEQSVVRVAAHPVAWTETQRIAGVSSFGMGGANAHVVLESAPAVSAEVREERHPAHLLPIAAKDAVALDAYVQAYLTYLDAHPHVNLGDLCSTAQMGRSPFAHRLSVVAKSVAELRTQLAAGAGQRGEVAAGQPTPQVAFLFTGQGSQ